MILSGSLEHFDTLFIEIGKKMMELWPLRRGAKMRTANKNYPNLTITLPNCNIFNKTSFIR